MARRSGLGKGLSSLIPPGEAPATDESSATTATLATSPLRISPPTHISLDSTSTRKRSRSSPLRSNNSASCNLCWFARSVTDMS